LLDNTLKGLILEKNFKIENGKKQVKKTKNFIYFLNIFSALLGDLGFLSLSCKIIFKFCIAMYIF